MAKRYGPGMGSSPPEMTAIDNARLVCAQQLRWARDQIETHRVSTLNDPSQMSNGSHAYLRGFADALTVLQSQMDRDARRER